MDTHRCIECRSAIDQIKRSCQVSPGESFTSPYRRWVERTAGEDFDFSIHSVRDRGRPAKGQPRQPWEQPWPVGENGCRQR